MSPTNPPSSLSPPPEATVWPALLLTPLLALGQISLTYALVTPACARQDSAALHGVAAASLVLALAMTALAWRTWSRLRRPAGGDQAVTDSDSGHAASRPRFVALLSTLVGALASLVIGALWLPLWILPPCS
jgi:hypothetical protein